MNPHAVRRRSVPAGPGAALCGLPRSPQRDRGGTKALGTSRQKVTCTLFSLWEALRKQGSPLADGEDNPQLIPEPALLIPVRRQGKEERTEPRSVPPNSAERAQVRSARGSGTPRQLPGRWAARRGERGQQSRKPFALTSSLSPYPGGVLAANVFHKVQSDKKPRNQSQLHSNPLRVPLLLSVRFFFSFPFEKKTEVARDEHSSTDTCADVQSQAWLGWWPFFLFLSFLFFFLLLFALFFPLFFPFSLFFFFLFFSFFSLLFYLFINFPRPSALPIPLQRRPPRCYLRRTSEGTQQPRGAVQPPPGSMPAAWWGGAGGRAAERPCVRRAGEVPTRPGGPTAVREECARAGAPGGQEEDPAPPPPLRSNRRAQVGRAPPPADGQPPPGRVRQPLRSGAPGERPRGGAGRGGTRQPAAPGTAWGAPSGRPPPAAGPGGGRGARSRAASRGGAGRDRAPLASPPPSAFPGSRALRVAPLAGAGKMRRAFL